MPIDQSDKITKELLELSPEEYRAITRRDSMERKVMSYLPKEIVMQLKKNKKSLLRIQRMKL
ncbi:hypothetical protein ACT0SS_002476 [Enterococcus faecalis]|nr:hypothetical protein [Enterococcus faecalis]